MPLASYDIIIGYPTINKYSLLDSLRASIPANVERISDPRLITYSTRLVQEPANTLEHVLLGALLRDDMGNNIPHISEFLDGSGDDGDDLSDLFNVESPWDTENKPDSQKRRPDRINRYARESRT